MSVALLVLGIVLFISLIVIHELGHFMVARRNGVDVEEFGIFFPPRLWSRKTKHGWDFSINLLPLGGFVRLKGEHDADTGKGTYGAARLKTKVKILLAGVFMNFIAAFVLFTILAWVGMPQLVNNQFTVKSDTHVIKNEVLAGYIEPSTPASKAGLKSTDQLIALIPKKGSKEVISSVNRLPQQTKKLAGQTIGVKYSRGGKISTTEVTLISQATYNSNLKSGNSKGYLGVSPTQYSLSRSTWSAPVVGAGLVWQLTILTLHGLGTALDGLFTGNTAKASSEVVGPVGIVVILKDGTLLGYQFILMIIAVISLSLAIMNVLPIPALDGGKLFVTLIWRALRKKLTEKAENIIYGFGFALLMVLLILITTVDVKRYF